MTVTYDPRGLTWDNYCRYMAELFAPNDLGTMPEEQWQQWAAGVYGIGYFAQSGVPDPRGFQNWQDWAMAVVGIMSIEDK
jgi:hypothetical protein